MGGPNEERGGSETSVEPVTAPKGPRRNLRAETSRTKRPRRNVAQSTPKPPRRNVALPTSKRPRRNPHDENFSSQNKFWRPYYLQETSLVEAV